MRSMIVLSLSLNVLVLTPICAGLLMNAAWAREAYGPATPASAILISVYLAIWAASLVLLYIRELRSTATLLSLQVLYKLTTPLTVGALVHPVVLSNLGIAVFHLVTLAAMWRAGAIGVGRRGG